MKKTLVLMLIALFALTAGAALAYDIPVPNASFDLVNGIEPTVWYSYWGGFYSWPDGTPGHVYDGTRFGQIGGNVRVQQALDSSVVIQAATLYTLSMYISKYPGTTPDDTELTLIATPTPGSELGVPFWSQSCTAFGATFVAGTGLDPDWNWHKVSVSFSTVDHPELVGGGLGIEFGLGGQTTNVDLVELTATPVPEPGSLFALASGLLGFVGLAVRRRS